MTKAIMTIHGFLTDAGDFGRLYDYLDCYDEVAPCHIPGHDEPLDFRQFTVEDTIQTVLDVYDSLAKKHDVVDVVGFSMGGALATYLATQRDVNKIVLIAPANKYINLATPFSTIRFYLRAITHSYLCTTGNFKQRVEGTRQALAPYLENIKSSNAVAVKRFFPNINMHTFTVFANLIKVINKEINKHKVLNNPTLLFWGKLDELVPKSSIDYLSKHIENLQKIIYPDVSHAIMLSHKDNVVIQETLKFLTNGKFCQEIPPKCR